MVQGQTRQIVLETPSPQITTANELEVLLKCLQAGSPEFKPQSLHEKNEKYRVYNLLSCSGFVFVFLFLMLGLKPRALQMLGKLFPAEQRPQPGEFHLCAHP
jgi:hypothetical protein